MSYVDFAMGVWYPKGGLHVLAQVFQNIGLKYGVEYHLNSDLTTVTIADEAISSLVFADGSVVSSDLYVINADQARFETTILPKEFQTYPKMFWDKKIFAPS